VKQLHIIAVQPDDLLYWWELRVWLTNLRKYNLSNRARVLLWTPSDRLKFERHPRWAELEKLFPETKFFYYEDIEDSLNTLIRPYNYIPLLRPITLEKHFREYPELTNDTIYYTDCDTVFTKDPLFLKGEWIQDDITRMSYTGKKETGYNYQNGVYIDGKIKDVLPKRLEQYNKIDVLQEMLDIFGLKRGFIEEQNQNFGGVQYLLKGVTPEFWKAVLSGCIYIRRYLTSINRRFFESEDKGIQSWCADLWSIQFNLWKLGIKSETPIEMSFAWATDPIADWDKYTIYHDAGASKGPIITDDKKEHYLFNKRAHQYINNISTPFEEDLSNVSNRFCSYNYVQCINEAK
jgi:hypothetical protein